MGGGIGDLGTKAEGNWEQAFVVPSQPASAKYVQMWMLWKMKIFYCKTIFS